MDAAEYKHVVLGLKFLKYISDAFDERHAQLQKEMSPCKRCKLHESGEDKRTRDRTGSDQ